MCHEYPAEMPSRAPACSQACATRPIVWGDIASDQADGFAGSDTDIDPGFSDLDDERGYGHGV